MIVGLVSLLSLFLIDQGSGSTVTTYYRTIWVREYVAYSSLPIFEHTVAEDTQDLIWEFAAGKSQEDCPSIPVYVQMQYDGYPLFDSPEKYPAHFYLQRSALFNLTLAASANASTVVRTAIYPLVGKWFGVAYILQEKDTAVRKITDQDCSYSIQFNVTSLSVTSRPFDLTRGQVLNQSLAGDSISYRFHITQITWRYEIRIWSCTVNGTSVSSCPLEVYTRAGAQPLDRSDANYLDCTKLKKCTLKVSGPNIDQLHYATVVKKTDQTVGFRVKLILSECQWPLLSDTPPLLDHVAGASNISTGDSRYRQAHQPSGLYIPECSEITVLNRVEDAQNDFYATYSVGVGGENIMTGVSESRPAIVAFDVLPLKDTGGTLRFYAEMLLSQLNLTSSFNVTVCITRSSIPVTDTGRYTSLHCEEKDKLTLSDSTPGLMSGVRYFPYPEPGRWLVGMQLVHCNGTVNESASLQVMFSITSSPCVSSQCQNGGECHDYYRGVYFFSSCDCSAGYRGYACTDDSHAKSKGTQLFYTLFLVLSNLGFIPSIVLSVKRRFYVEALVYFSNMFFSGFYHACDMRHWSIDTLCIMPYHVLSYCDFFCSIMSFWVTLLALAELPAPLTHFAHMVGAVALAMGVEWQIHGMWPYIAPVVAGVVMIIISWIRKSVVNRSFYPGKKRLLWMLPGFVIAGAALCVAGFVETDANYPFSHSAWHLAISLCILFLLPPQGYYYNFKLRASGSNGDCSTESDSSSNSEILVLLPADSVNGHLEFNDDDVPLNTDILLNGSYDDDDEPLRDLL